MNPSTEALIKRAQSWDSTAELRELDRYPGIAAMLAERAANDGERVFLRYFDDETGEKSRFTYREFVAGIEAAAAFLLDRDIQPGDCIATLSFNHPISVILLFAAWRIGAVVAPQNVGEDDRRIGFILGDAGVRMVFAHPACLPRAKDIVASCGAASLRDIPVLDFNEVLRQPIVAMLPPLTDDSRDRDALLVYTSGTTGNPKGVMLSQRNLLLNAAGTAHWHRFDSSTRFMCVLPVHHVNGIVVTLLTPLAAGGSVVLCRAFKPGLFWSRIATEGVNVVSVVPTMLQYLCEMQIDTRALDLSGFRYPICGAGTLAISLVERFESRFGVRIVHGYGLSETTAFACSIPPDLDEAGHCQWMRGSGYPSIGTPLALCEMAIHDAGGNPQPPGARGEIVIRGPYVMSGYFHRPDANAETFRYGWFRSGDEGFYELDRHGRRFFFITGRIKELINRGGVKYSPFEIEEILLSIPGVRAGLAIGFDSDWYGEEVGAYVVLAPGAAVTENEILAACRLRMPFAKCPKVVVFGEDIPMTLTGKYQRLKLKPLFAAFHSTQFRN